MRTTAAADLVSPGAAGWCEEFLSTSRADRWLRASARSAATRSMWRLLERATHSGIVRHWMLRKCWIESRVRAKIAAGASQVVVLGAGLDTLGVRLASERPDLRVVEIDHPATLAVKQSVVKRKLASGGPILAAADLSRDDATGSLLPAGVIDRSLSSVFLAEGLLMYLPKARVRSLLRELATATDPASWVVFSFMVEREGGAIGFEPRSGAGLLVAVDEGRAVLLVVGFGAGRALCAGARLVSHSPCRFDRAGRARHGAAGNRAIVTGEEIVEATTTESGGTPTLRADSPKV